MIVDRHFKAIHRYLARRVGRECADDLAAQTFTVAFERRASHQTSKGWVATASAPPELVPNP